MSKRWLLVFCLAVVCTLLWAIHTLLFVHEYAKGYQKVLDTRHSIDHQPLPTLVICNKFPFNQPDLDRFGASFNQDIVLEYLRHWLEHSYGADPSTIPLNSSAATAAEGIISQNLLGDSFKQHLDSFLLPCPQLLAQCVVQGALLSGPECCASFVKPYLSTLEGLCFVFEATNVTQEGFMVDQGIRLDFKIAHDSFSPVRHPGIKLFIKPPNSSALRLATELDQPIELPSGKSVSALIQRETTSFLGGHCGQTSEDAHSQDSANSTKPSLPQCLVEESIRMCRCVPLSVVLWVYRGDFSGQLISQLNATSICTAGEYDRCSRAFMEVSRPAYWNTEVATLRNRLATSLRTCKSKARLPCQQVNYNPKISTQQIPTTNDYTATFSVAYESTDLIEKIHQPNPSFFELLSFAGYNLALWFAIAFLFWLFLTTTCCRFNKTAHKVKPGPSLVQSAENSRPSSQDQVLVGRNVLPPIGTARSIQDSTKGLVRSIALPSTSST
uniref:Amiloride-sensitive cation channel 5 n=2 Tax=Bursaphelenchus xylophilus TaxID=6326 RepID=A0A1I7SFB6_BURXY